MPEPEPTPVPMTFKTTPAGAIPDEESLINDKSLQVTTVTKASSIKDSHIRVAMLVAAGEKNVHIAEKTGFAPGTISGWKRQKWFQELVESWKGVAHKDFDNKMGVVRSLFDDTAQLIRERIHNDEMDNRTLADLFKTLAPKVGVQDAPQRVEHGIASDTLRVLREEQEQRRVASGRVIAAETRIVDDADEVANGDGEAEDKA